MNVFSTPVDHSDSSRARRTQGDGHLAAASRLQPSEACAEVGSCLESLSQTEAAERQKKIGLNLVTRERIVTILQELWDRARNPLNALLLTLATVCASGRGHRRHGDPRDHDGLHRLVLSSGG
jgi:Mg2+-importing ATPase